MKKFLFLLLMAFTVLVSGLLVFSGCEKGDDAEGRWTGTGYSFGSIRWSYQPYDALNGSAPYSLDIDIHGEYDENFGGWVYSFEKFSLYAGSDGWGGTPRCKGIDYLTVTYPGGSVKLKGGSEDGYGWVLYADDENLGYFRELVSNFKKNVTMEFKWCEGYSFIYKATWPLPPFTIDGEW